MMLMMLLNLPWVVMLNLSWVIVVLAVEASVVEEAEARLDSITSCLKKVFTSETSLTTMLGHSRSFRVHVSAKIQNQPRITSYWCFAPSLAMNQLLSLGMRSMIVTSGTLSPLSFYALELGMPFPITLSNPHVLACDLTFYFIRAYFCKLNVIFYLFYFNYLF